MYAIILGHVKRFLLRFLYLFKSVSKVTLYDCKDIGLEPINWRFCPDVYENDQVIFRLGGKKVKLMFNFDEIVKAQLLKSGEKEGIDGAPYLASTIKTLYPDFYTMWEKYNESVSHLK